jgi:hypothetical protein
MMLFLGLIASLNSSLDGFRHYPVILIALAAGLAGDILYRLLRPYEGRLWAYRLIAAIVPVVLWGLYFGWMHLTAGIGWETELWTGAIVQAALLSIVLSLLAISAKEGDAYGKAV